MVIHMNTVQSVRSTWWTWPVVNDNILPRQLATDSVLVSYIVNSVSCEN